MRCLHSLWLIAFLGALPSIAQVPSGANDYPQWRGPNRDGISPDKGLIREWPESGPRVIWQIDDAGVGYSSVALRDDLIVTMGDLNGVEHTIALNRKDGSRVWAVQPASVAEKLSERVAAELAGLDTNGDGKVDESEALKKLGWNFYKFDRGESNGAIQERAGQIFDGLDSDSDGKLTFGEASKLYRDQFQKMDAVVGKVDRESATGIAEKRTDALLKESDADGDGSISKKEARSSYCGVIFSKADKKVGDSRKGDNVLTRDEIMSYLSKRERGQDGVLTRDEMLDYYAKNVTAGDGTLSAKELASFYGGYRNGQGDGPRGTPTIDGDRVYSEGGNGDLACYDLRTGKTHWHISLTADLGGSRPGWGFSESPLIVGEWVIVTPGGDQGTLAALNKTTGEVVWRSTDITEKAHYSSPIVTTIAGREQIVQFARESMFGVELQTGKLLWQYDGANNGTANCCTPVVHADHVFAASAYGTGGGLAKITNDGDKQKAEEVYFEKKMGVHHGGIVKVGDYMYTNGAGTLTCIDFLSGDIAWQSRSVGKGSLTVADGMLYVLGEKHELALAEATPEAYREHGRIELEGHGRPSWAHPVVVGGVLYVRDQGTLTAYAVR